MSDFLGYLDYLRNLEKALRLHYQQRINNEPLTDTSEKLISAMNGVSSLINSSLVNNFQSPVQQLPKQKTTVEDYAQPQYGLYYGKNVLIMYKGFRFLKVVNVTIRIGNTGPPLGTSYQNYVVIDSGMTEAKVQRVNMAGNPISDTLETIQWSRGGNMWVFQPLKYSETPSIIDLGIANDEGQKIYVPT
jgi:hypothetical protein